MKKSITQLYQQSKGICACSKTAKANLWKLQFTELDIEAKYKLYYYLGRILSKEKSKDFKTLERVNAYYFDAIEIANESGFRISWRLIHSAAQTKLLISEQVKNRFDRLNLRKEGLELINKGLDNYPKKSQLLKAKEIFSKLVNLSSKQKH